MSNVYTTLRSITFAALIYPAFSLAAGPAANFLTAAPQERLNIALNYDKMNERYDVFKLDKKGQQIEYSGSHLTLTSDVFDNIRVEGSYWKRKLNVSETNIDVESWHGALQYNFFTSKENNLHIAARVAYAENIGSNTTQNQNLSNEDWLFKLQKPNDKQQSLDVIASYSFNEQVDINGFIGFGKNKTDYKGYEITTFRNGCQYSINVDLERKRYLGLRNTGYICSPSNGIIIEEIGGPLSDKDAQKLNRNLNPKNLSYDANFMQLGFSLGWRIKQWELRGGYRFNKQDRKGVDSFVKQHGGVTMDKNHILTGQIMYNFLPYLAGSFTAQYFHNQLLGEIPFLYNGSTSKHFDRHFGLISVGIHAKWK